MTALQTYGEYLANTRLSSEVSYQMIATTARTQTKMNWPYIPNTLRASTGYPMWYLAPGRPSARATEEEIKFALKAC
jgi:hypothetical protein